jgi:hypothetical protein
MIQTLSVVCIQNNSSLFKPVNGKKLNLIQFNSTEIACEKVVEESQVKTLNIHMKIWYTYTRADGAMNLLLAKYINIQLPNFFKFCQVVIVIRCGEMAQLSNYMFILYTSCKEHTVKEFYYVALVLMSGFLVRLTILYIL